MTQRCSLLLVLLLAASVCTFGQLVDPATFHTGNGVAGTCPTGVGASPCTGITGGEVLPISGTNFDIFQEAGNSFTFSDPLVLIAAVPNTAGVTLTGTEITSATEFNPYTAATGTALTFGTGVNPLNYNMTDTFDQGAMTSATPSNVYDFLGGDASGANN